MQRLDTRFDIQIDSRRDYSLSMIHQRSSPVLYRDYENPRQGPPTIHNFQGELFKDTMKLNQAIISFSRCWKGLPSLHGY